MVLRLILFVLFSLLVFGVDNARSDTGYFWHVTDFHYDPTYWTAQLSCNKRVLKPGLYGDYWCDSNWLLVEDSIKNMKAIKADVDFVIWTGDTMAHIKDKDTDLDCNIEVLRNVTDVFKKYFPKDEAKDKDKGVAFLPSLGNHDFYPSDQASTVKEDIYYRQSAEVWKEWITDPFQLEYYLIGGYYTHYLSPKLLLMSLNTNLYYNKNKLVNDEMADPAGQFAWMETVFNQARTDGQKVIVTAHVTPGVLTPNMHTWMYPKLHKRYVEKLIENHDVIVASHYGHDHSDGFKIIQEPDQTSKAVAQFVAPSITPWKYMEGAPAHNPGIRLVEYDRETGRHINYKQYFINLTDTNARGSSQWEMLYDFKELYGVDDMSVACLRNIFDKIKGDDGMKLAQSYCNNAVVSRLDKHCSHTNRYEIVCGGKHYDFNDANVCLQEYIKAAGSTGSANVLILNYLILGSSVLFSLLI